MIGSTSINLQKFVNQIVHWAYVAALRKGFCHKRIALVLDVSTLLMTGLKIAEGRRKRRNNGKPYRERKKIFGTTSEKMVTEVREREATAPIKLESR